MDREQSIVVTSPHATKEIEDVCTQANVHEALSSNQHPTLRGGGWGEMGAIRVPVLHSRFSSVF